MSKNPFTPKDPRRQIIISVSGGFTMAILVVIIANLFSANEIFEINGMLIFIGALFAGVGVTVLLWSML